MTKKLTTPAIVAVGLVVIYFWARAFADGINCDRAEKEYFKWGYYAATTNAPEALGKLAYYEARMKECERD